MSSSLLATKVAEDNDSSAPPEVSDANTTAFDRVARMSSSDWSRKAFASSSSSPSSSLFTACGLKLTAPAPCFSNDSCKCLLPALADAMPSSTALSNDNLAVATAYMCASYVPAVSNRYTVTFLVCPIRWHRAMACTSFCGFQSES